MKNKVFVIDDDRHFLEEVKESLTLNEYEVETLDDASKAVERITQARPDIILLDMHMPQESGFQVACKIKTTKGLKHIPIIAVTGCLSGRQIKVVKDYSIAYCLQKPFDPLELVMNIERVL